MKWGAILLVTGLLQVACVAQTPTVNFTGKEVPLKKVFSSIKNQTGYVFFYDISLLHDAKTVTVKLNNAPLEAALNAIFKDQPITWVLEDKTIVIIKKPGQTNNTKVPVIAKPNPPPQVKGRVTDDEGYPVLSVSVVVKGKRKGSVTDSNGVYMIQGSKADVLVFSSVSYGTKEVRVMGTEMNMKLQREPMPMELLAVGGNMGPIKRKADATSVTVLDSKTLEGLPVNTMDQVFRGLVPGTNSFDVGDDPEQFPTLSIRGAASATSLSTISVYVDGIEYAGGSGYLFQLDKTNIDRIEVVRGPGAATMYGTGSNGGIVQIFTKKGKPGRTSLNFTTGAGFYKSKWVQNDPFQQLHNLELVTGYKRVALTLGGSYRTVGAYLPEGGEKNKGLYGGTKFNLGKLQANLVGRYNSRNFNISRDPTYDTAIHPRTDIILEPLPGFFATAYQWFNVQPRPSQNKRGLTETTILGINLSHRTTSDWVNNIAAGYTFNGTAELPVQNDTVPLQRQYYSAKDKITTIRYFNVFNLQRSNGFAAVISTGAEYKKYSSVYSYTRSTAAATVLVKYPDNENYGAFLQVNPSYKNVYLTMGIRYEKNDLFNGVWNPRMGLTTNFEKRSIIFKPKVSWGRGIIAPSYQSRFGSPPNAFTVVYSNPGIKPQAQQGVDYGLEMYDKKGRFRVEVIRYDNTIKDLIAQVNLGADTINPNLAAFAYTNVAEVANNGWEFSGEWLVKRFSLLATFSIMNSAIKDTTGASNIAFLKGKAPGTELPKLPKHTAGLNFTYNFFKLFARADKGAVSLSLTEVDGIKSADYVSYALDVAYGRTPYDPDLAEAGYETKSSPLFRLGLNANYFITSDFRLFIQASNILNSYKFEYSSDYPTHGATWLFGFKYNITKDN